MDTILAITKALAEEKRLRILMALQGRELCSCELSAMLDLTESTVSTHMAILKRAGLVEGRKGGRWVHYRLPQAPSREAARALRWLVDALKDKPIIQKDVRTLKEVQKC